jgi:hypothetical protein
VEALHKLAQHLDLLRAQITLTEGPMGPATVNYTEICLEGLSIEELRVIERVLLRKAVVDQQYGLPPSPPVIEHPSTNGGGSLSRVQEALDQAKGRGRSTG